MTLQEILKSVKSLPTVGKILSLIAIVIFLVVSVFFTTACGSTRAVVTNRATDTVTEIKITTNNPTSVSVPVSPNVSLTQP